MYRFKFNSIVILLVLLSYLPTAHSQTALTHAYDGPMKSSGIDTPESNLIPGSLFVRTQAYTRCQRKISFSDSDEIWRVCARTPNGEAGDRVCPTIYRLQCGGWVASNLDSLVRSHQLDPIRQTVLYVHGNRTDSEWSIARASQMYEQVFGNNHCNERGPVRFIIWQWTAETELPNPLRDFKVKAQRSVEAGRAFAEVVNRLKSRSMIVVGYSLGAQVISSALTTPVAELGEEVASTHELVFIAPVFDENYWPELCEAVPWLPICRTTSFRNQKDPALRLIANPLGRRGQFRNAFTWFGERPDLFGPTQIVDLENELKDKHAIVEYSSAPSLQNFLRNKVSHFQTEPRLPIGNQDSGNKD